MSMKENLSSKTSVINVEMEVEKRKYEVNIPSLMKCLSEHRTMPITEIAEKLDKPLTLVQHWFRKDRYFAIPDADAWMDLKEILNIQTDEFDKSIMTFVTDGANYDMRNRIYIGDVSPTLTANSENNLHIVLENHPADSRVKICEDNVFQTLSSRMGTGGGNVPMVLEPVAYRGDSITSSINASNPQPGDACHTLVNDGRNYVVERGEEMEQNEVKILNPSDSQGNQIADASGTYPTLRGCGNAGYQAGYLKTEEDNYINSVVRRLTPLECERLDGFPDNWTNIGEWVDSKGKVRKCSDANRYKALGNSIGLPWWQWVANRIVNQLKEDGVEKPTMASLFDGISGFCLVFKRCGCEPIWSSEVEEFCIAVAKKHFGDDEKGEEGDYEQYL